MNIYEPNGNIEDKEINTRENPYQLYVTSSVSRQWVRSVTSLGKRVENPEAMLRAPLRWLSVGPSGSSSSFVSRFSWFGHRSVILLVSVLLVPWPSGLLDSLPSHLLASGSPDLMVFRSLTLFHSVSWTPGLMVFQALSLSLGLLASGSPGLLVFRSLIHSLGLWVTRSLAVSILFSVFSNC